MEIQYSYFTIRIWKRFRMKLEERCKMKMRKKTGMILALAIGATVFVTTAAAEVTTNSGYDQLKTTLKFTAEQLTEKATITQWTHPSW